MTRQAQIAAQQTKQRRKTKKHVAEWSFAHHYDRDLFGRPVVNGWVQTNRWQLHYDEEIQ